MKVSGQMGLLLSSSPGLVSCRSVRTGTGSERCTRMISASMQGGRQALRMTESRSTRRRHPKSVAVYVLQAAKHRRWLGPYKQRKRCPIVPKSLSTCSSRASQLAVEAIQEHELGCVRRSGVQGALPFTASRGRQVGLAGCVTAVQGDST